MDLHPGPSNLQHHLAAFLPEGGYSIFTVHVLLHFYLRFYCRMIACVSVQQMQTDPKSAKELLFCIFVGITVTAADRVLKPPVITASGGRKIEAQHRKSGRASYDSGKTWENHEKTKFPGAWVRK